LESFFYSLDVAVFRFFNETLSSPSLDAFFSYITNFRHAGILTVIILFILYQLVWGGAKGRWLVLSLVVSLTLSDQGSSHLLKFLVQRIRPCNALQGVLTPAGGSGAFSFPSSHASNMGSSMFLLAKNFPPFKWFFVWIALLVGLSRIYLGLHYPSDVLGGYLFGLGIGWVVWEIVGKLRASFQHQPIMVPVEAPVEPLAVKKRTRKKVSRARKKR
jgi:undecaprenyl-diphosphatase